jgi:hypothetical protein
MSPVIRHYTKELLEFSLSEGAFVWIKLHEEELDTTPDGTLAPAPALRAEFLARAAELFDSTFSSILVDPEPVTQRVLLRPDELSSSIPRAGTPCIYFHLTGSEEVLYIGMTMDALARQRQHRTGSHWWDQIERIEFVTFESYKEMAVAEIEAIDLHRPVFNKLGIEDRP